MARSLTYKQGRSCKYWIAYPVAIVQLRHHCGLSRGSFLEGLELHCKTCHHFAKSHENGQGRCKATDDDPRENGLTCDGFCTEFAPDTQTYPTYIFPKLRGPLISLTVPSIEWEMLSDEEAKKLNDYWRDAPPLGVKHEYRKESLDNWRFINRK